MRATGCVNHSCLGPLTDGGLLVVGVAFQGQGVGKSEGPDEFGGHAAGEIDDFVMPEVPVETAVGRRMRVPVLESQDFGDLSESLPGEEFLNHGWRPYSTRLMRCWMSSRSFRLTAIRSATRPRQETCTPMRMRIAARMRLGSRPRLGS